MAPARFNSEQDGEGGMILGLRRGEVRLVAHQPGWPAAFVSEKERLAQRLGISGQEIEHVGSTAVPDLVAKPIIDIALGVSSLADTGDWPQRLGPDGYAFFGDREGWGEHFYAKGPEENRTIYLHVVPIQSARWSEYLKFRDSLRASAGLRKEYGGLKRDLLAAHQDDRNAYTGAKAAFIRRVLA
jgi:GrpB-like predicted nucleotidyltransferase (UPF0157 family)